MLTVGIFCFHLTSVCAHIFGSTAHWISMTRPESYLTYTVYAGKIVCAVWKGRNEPERRQIFEARTDPEHATSFKLKLSALFFFSSVSIRILKVFSLPPPLYQWCERKEKRTRRAMDIGESSNGRRISSRDPPTTTTKRESEQSVDSGRWW